MELDLGALSPSGGQTGDVPRMTLSGVSWKGKLRPKTGKEMPAITSHPQPESRSLSYLGSLDPVLTAMIVTGGTSDSIMG